MDCSTHFTVNSIVSRVKTPLPAKNGGNPHEEFVDNSRIMIRHADVRRFAGKELKPLLHQMPPSLHKDRTDDGEDLVCKTSSWWIVLLDGLVLESDASTTGEGAACWNGAHQLAQGGPPNGYVTTRWTHEDEELLGTKQENPAHQAILGSLHGVVLAIRHSVTKENRVGW